MSSFHHVPIGVVPTASATDQTTVGAVDPDFRRRRMPQEMEGRASSRVGARLEDADQVADLQVGQRNLFTQRIERLFLALTDKAPTYEYPRIWNTKGETLAVASALANPPTWHDTRSCWQDSRRVSFEGERRQCGVCAACMLRRMSIYSAKIEEPASRYIWEDLGAAEMEDGVVAGFTGLSPAFRDYGLAGILHLDHLAALNGSALHERTVRRVARETADALGIEMAEGERALTGLLERHRAEWLGFVASLGRRSFVARVAMVSPWH